MDWTRCLRCKVVRFTPVSAPQSHREQTVAGRYTPVYSVSLNTKDVAFLTETNRSVAHVLF